MKDEKKRDEEINALLGFYCTICGKKFDPRIVTKGAAAVHIMEKHYVGAPKRSKYPFQTVPERPNRPSGRKKGDEDGVSERTRSPSRQPAGGVIAPRGGD